MADPTPAQVEAAAEAALAARIPGAVWAACPPSTQDEWRAVARAALTAAAQVQPAPEADEREAAVVGAITPALDRAQEHSTTLLDSRERMLVGHGAQAAAEFVLARRSQPAPRTVSARVDGQCVSLADLAALGITVEAPRG